MALSSSFVSRLFGGLLLLLLTACQAQRLLPDYEAADSSQLPPLRDYPGLPPRNFCQLPTLPRQLVYVRGLYLAGGRESSHFQPLPANSPPEPPCLGALELNLSSAAPLPAPMEAKFRAIHQVGDYRPQYLVVDAIGHYEQDKPGGYGHLGEHQGQFVVRELVQVTHVVAKKRKGRRILRID